MAQHVVAERQNREGWASLLEDLTGVDRERASELVACCSRVTATDGHEMPIPVDIGLVVVESGTVLLAAPAATRAPILAFLHRGDLLIAPVEGEDTEQPYRPASP